MVQYIIDRGAIAAISHLNFAILRGDYIHSKDNKAKGVGVNDNSLPAALNSKNLEIVELAASWGGVVTEYGFRFASPEMQYKLGLYQASCDLAESNSRVESLLSRLLQKCYLCFKPMLIRRGFNQESPNLPEIHVLKESLMQRAINGSMLDEMQFRAIKDLKSPYVQHIVNQYKKDIVVGICLPNQELSPDAIKIISGFIGMKDASNLLHAKLLKDSPKSHADKVVAGKTAAESNGPAR